MRSLLIVSLCAALLAALPVLADNPETSYRIEFAKGSEQVKTYDEPDKKGMYVTVRFKLIRPEGVKPSGKDEIVIREEGQVVQRIRIGDEQLTTMLVLDVSGGMAYNDKIGEAKKAANVFLDMVGDRADTGLILIPHRDPGRENALNQEVLLNDPARVRRPSGDPNRYQAQANEIRKLIANAQPQGGSAYRDATSKAVDLLANVKGKRVIVLMTDGVDVNSSNTLEQVIQKARKEGVAVYAVGIGEKGLTTVLVLDQSGSMAAPANDTDKKTKIDALKESATQFVELMRPGTKATLLPFSTEVETPQPFSNDKNDLLRRIRRLTPKDGTSLYDATMAGIETLVAANPEGYRAVLVLTDGKDESPGSRYSDQAVIERAKETGVKLFTLGLGRKNEINEKVMIDMARRTGGEYFHSSSASDLLSTFQRLSRDLGEEEALQRLAKETGGTYYPASNVGELQSVFKQVATAVQSDYTVEFKSVRDVHDGTARNITFEVKDAQGRTISNVEEVRYNVRGLVVPEQSPTMYLVLLGLVVGCLAVPTGLRALLGSAKAA